MYRAGFGYIYGFGGSIIASALLTVGVVSVRTNLIFSIVSIASVSTAALLADTTIAIRVFSIIGSGMVLFVSHMTLRQRIEAEEKYLNEHEMNLKRQKQALQKEIDESKLMQETFRETEIPLENLSIRKIYRPSFFISGDWVYHVFDEKRSTVFAWIGDVTGHGAASALIAALMHGALKVALTKIDLSLTNAEALKTAANIGNRIILDTQCERLMTAILIALDVKTGNLDILNCGHPFPIIKLSSGDILPITSRGNPLGTEELQTNVKSCLLASGDELFCYTDGLTENGFPNDLISRKTIRTLLKQSSNQDDLIDKLTYLCGVHENKGLNNDDVTVLHLKYMPAQLSHRNPSDSGSKDY
jgi:serine phosphatase RsbU (regulator of sigma subunit)